MTAALVIAATAARAADATRITTEPAATLLLPYFEVELPKKPGKAHGRRTTTIFQIANGAAAATLARVTVWSDLAVPVTAFDVYLTGYDVQQIDLFDVVEGRFPATDPGGNAPGCAEVLPPPPSQGEEFALHMRAALTGAASALFGGQCAGLDHGERKPVARGYVTVDAVSQCSLLFPDAPGYFIAGGQGIATNENVLWGDWFVVDRKRKTTYGDALVAVRADAADPATSTPGNYTFYAAQVGATAADNRQPLAWTFGGRYVDDGRDPFFGGGTSLVVWRDPKVKQGPFPCEALPAWHPLPQQQVVVFDDQENAEEPSFPVPPPPAPEQPLVPFAAATQKVTVGGPTLPVSFTRGWFYLSLGTTVAGQVPLGQPDVAQAMVLVLHDGKRFRTMQRAVHFESAAAP